MECLRQLCAPTSAASLLNVNTTLVLTPRRTFTETLVEKWRSELPSGDPNAILLLLMNVRCLPFLVTMLLDPTLAMLTVRAPPKFVLSESIRKLLELAKAGLP